MSINNQIEKNKSNDDLVTNFDNIYDKHDFGICIIQRPATIQDGYYRSSTSVAGSSQANRGAPMSLNAKRTMVSSQGTNISIP